MLSELKESVQNLLIAYDQCKAQNQNLLHQHQKLRQQLALTKRDAESLHSHIELLERELACAKAIYEKNRRCAIKVLESGKIVFPPEGNHLDLQERLMRDILTSNKYQELHNRLDKALDYIDARLRQGSVKSLGKHSQNNPHNKKAGKSFLDCFRKYLIVELVAVLPPASAISVAEYSHMRRSKRDRYPKSS